MSAPRFARLLLDYGCHSRDVVLPGDDSPFVVAGPNGSGKTTLLEALVRIPFGYNRRQEREGHDHRERRPWSGEPYRGRVTLIDGRGAVHTIERDFSSAHVKVEQDAQIVWEGDGNPAASNLEARAYRERLRALFGIVSSDAYAGLAWVRQGELVDTRVDEHLLRLATGGTHDVERARATIADALRALTRAPVNEGGRAGRAPRPVEELHGKIETLRERLAEARAARDRRAPLVGEVERLNARSSAVAAELGRLEAAHGAVGRRDALARERERLEDRVLAAERVYRRLEREADNSAGLDEAWAAIDAESMLPPDFPERATRLEQLAERLEQAERRQERADESLRLTAIPSGAWVFLPAVAFAGAVAAWWLGQPAIAALAGAGAIGWLVAVVRHRSLAVRTHTERFRTATTLANERGTIEEALEAERRELPPLVGTRGLAGARADWLHQDALRRERERAGDALARATADAVELLEGSLFRGAAEGNARSRSDGVEAARRVATRLGEHVTVLRNRLAESAIRVRDADADPDLGPGMDEAASIATGLRRLRAERDQLDADLRRAERRLLEEGRARRSPLSIEEELSESQAALDELEERVDVLRAALALVAEAHSSFREHDQRRLIESISSRVLALSGGSLGPVELDAEQPSPALVRFGDRRLPLRCPPLSYGQYHSVLLGVRLGASEFLAKSGPRLPLILDEPFAHLDGASAAAVWAQLVRLSAERQVVIATQETEMLDRLGVSPAIRLSGATDRVRP